MWLIRASLRNPYMVAALVFAIAIVGLLSALSIPVDVLPVFKAPAVQVLTYYPGMPASSVEKTITNRIERWVNQAPGARLVESRSVPGVSVVKIYFRDDINSNEALTLTNSLALGALPNLPPNTLPPVALPFDATGTLPVGILTVANPRLDDARQKDVARINVRNMLGAVPGCIAPIVVGGQDRTVLIYLDQNKLLARNLVSVDVVSALRKGNLLATPGSAYFGPNQVLLDSNSMVENVEDLNMLPITFGPQAGVLLQDVGHAEDSATIQTCRVRIDDQNEVFVPVYRQQGSSSLAVANGVRDRIPYMEERLPKETTLKLVMDQTIAIRSALVALVEEGVIGAILISIMILFFLGNWRMTVIATLSIPLALLGAIVGLYVTGNTINTMTLGGLALAIGPLVDDAIVELENNHRNYHLGKSRIRAALDGCAEVMVPVMVATCTTVIVLAPLTMMPGMGGFLFAPLTIAVGFAMLTSFLLSRTFVPMMCAKFLPDEHRPSAMSATGGIAENHVKPAGFFSRVSASFQSFIDQKTVRYTQLLDWALGHRGIVVTAIVALFIASLFLTLKIGREFFPQVDAGQLSVMVRAPSNLRLDETEKRVIDVEEFLKASIPASERDMIVSEIGLNPDWSAAYTPNSGQQDAAVRVQLNKNRALTSQEYAIKLRHLLEADGRFADLRFSFDTGGMISTALNQGAASPIDIEIEGGTTEQSLDLAKSIRNEMSTIPGAADVRVHQRNDAAYLVINIDREKAATMGMTAEDVIQQVVIAMNSSVSILRNFWIDSKSGNQYFVGVQYPEQLDRTIEDVLSIPVIGAGQANSVDLGSLVTVTRRADAVEINHSGLRRVSNVYVNTENRDIAGIAADIHKRLDKMILPEGMYVRLKGEYARMNESFQSLLYGLGLATLLVYLLLVTLFRSWVGPFITIFTVPLGFIGVLAMLFVTNTTINVQSLMGVIFLVGISVNNGVLLVDFANKQAVNGLNPTEAIKLAAATRFRPIVMTFLATVLALTPMAIGFGKGNEANIPLARAVVGGMLTSTALTLFMVPIMYTLLMRKVRQDPDIEAELAA